MAANVGPIEQERDTNAQPLVRISSARVGITARPDTGGMAVHDTGGVTKQKHPVKRALVAAAIGGGAGLVIGAVTGAVYDSHPSDAIIPATPVLAAVGLGVGLVAGLLVGLLTG